MTDRDRLYRIIAAAVFIAIVLAVVKLAGAWKW